MIIIKIVFAILLGLISWLLYGSPDITLAGNFFIWGSTICHLLIIIFNREIFGLLGGDVFTYGMANLGINLASFGWTLLGGFIVLFRYDQHIEKLNAVPSLVWGLLLLGILGSVLIPLLSTRHITSLPNRDDRREYEPPRSN